MEFSHLPLAHFPCGVLAHQVVAHFVCERFWVVESTLDVMGVHVVLASYVPEFSIDVWLGAVDAYGRVREQFVRQAHSRRFPFVRSDNAGERAEVGE